MVDDAIDNSAEGWRRAGLPAGGTAGRRSTRAACEKRCGRIFSPNRNAVRNFATEQEFGLRCGFLVISKIKFGEWFPAGIHADMRHTGVGTRVNQFEAP